MSSDLTTANKAEPPALNKPGAEWGGQETFAVKTWYAETFGQRAFSVALLRLGGEPRLAKATFAEQAVLEWYQDRFDRMVRNYDPVHGKFPAFAASDLAKYVTGTFARKLRRQWNREQPESLDNEETGETESIFGMTAGDDARENLERIDLLRELIARLSEEDHLLLGLVASGFSREEIAERYGISPGNARIKIFRARTRARTILKEIET